ncbi:SPOR domain-containing protein [Paracoccus gahaiensis]|uniref:SPOR domain-containing protein n=1 Tax=Paracoccus gahaiensis TaxID=1706839 RepID=A0A4U0RF27_9RHOB|nr:SPOR domain-containing protein [Paracoccus gahaiensis]TJZ93915.1 SPOR domain-containing protein [Paracoccus gahaiensis]
MDGRWRIVAVMMTLGAVAQAAPRPPPPDGFSGAQYIDAQGCVFTRDEVGWTPRMDGQGRAICGFPPSMTARRTDPGADRVLPLTEDAPPDVETLLMEQLSRDLRPGEWTADPRPAETRSEPAPSRRLDPVQTALEDAMAVAPALREASGLGGSSDLCARLGYRPDPEGTRQGLSLGLCPGMRVAPLTIGTVQVVAPDGPPVPLPPATVAAAPAIPAPPKAAPGPVVRARPIPVAAPARSTAVAKASAPRPAATSTEGPEMIPASARYVQIGAYGDEAAAKAAMQDLSGRGYAVGQGRVKGDASSLRLVMAGPFADRRALIVALNDLRRSGYPAAVAR